MVFLKCHVNGFTCICCWIHLGQTNKDDHLVILSVAFPIGRFLRLLNHDFPACSPLNIYCILACNHDFPAHSPIDFPVVSLPVNITLGTTHSKIRPKPREPTITTTKHLYVLLMLL